MSQNILEVQNLNTRLNIGSQTYSVVEDLSFCLKKGKTLALVGESGCGKTMSALSLLRILPGSACQPEGKAFFKEKNLLSLPENQLRSIRGKDIAMVFQDPSSALNPVYTIGNQLLETIDLHLALREEESIQKAIEALSEVGIPSPRDLLDAYPHQLSGGLKQRVMIAIMLACEPDILIADEPTTALDVTIQAQVLELIRTLQHKKGMALLLITHDMGIVAEMADDVIVMYASQAIEQGSVFDIFDKSAHPYTKGLFESLPQMGHLKEPLKSIRGSVPPLTHYPKGCRFHPRCPYAMEKCKSGTIPNFSVPGSALHESRCLLHDGTLESAEKLIQIGALYDRAST